MAEDSGRAGWVTWQQAADLVGCTVGTIEHYSRTGRILSRPRQGQLPTLEQESVEEFAAWWAAYDAKRAVRRTLDRRSREAQRAPSAAGPPEETGWVTAAEAAEQLGLAEGYVSRGDISGRWPVRSHEGRKWMKVGDLERLAAERTQWLSYVGAAALTGNGPGVVAAAVRRGEFVTRGSGKGALPSLGRESVLAWAERRREHEAKKQAKAKPQDHNEGPPVDEHVWLSTATAALVIGLSPAGLGKRAAAGRVPFTRVGRRRWFRRDHMEQVAAARAFMARPDADLR